MHERLLYWFELSIALCAVYFLFLANQWGLKPLPITELLLEKETSSTKAVWLYVDSGISRYWNLLTVPLVLSAVVLFDETDDFYETFGFIFFGLVAYGFWYFAGTEILSLCFLLLLGLTIALKLQTNKAIRISYTILIVCAVYTWLFPSYSIGLFMYATFTLVFTLLIAASLITRIWLKKLQLIDTKTT